MKVSKLIAQLQEMEKTYGDLNVTLHSTYPETDNVVPSTSDNCSNIVRSDDIWLGYDTYKDEPNKIDIRNFPY